MLPTYLVIGAAKCGTSSLCHLLGRHPEAFMSRPKEIHFFGRDDPAKTPEWYEAFFEGGRGKKAVGEGSTSYTHPEIIEVCAAQIAARIPACRLIYMVRNPLDRLESDWKMRRHDGWAVGSVNQAVERHSSLITLGFYWKNLSVYRRHFADEQIRIVFLEDFTRNAETELRACLEHIGVDPEVQIPEADRARNAASGYRNYGTLASRLRRGSWFAAIKGHIPRWAMDAAKSVLTEKVTYVPEWDPAVRSATVARFEEDSGRFLEFCGKPPDFWSRRSAPSGHGQPDRRDAPPGGRSPA